MCEIFRVKQTLLHTDNFVHSFVIRPNALSAYHFRYTLALWFFTIDVQEVQEILCFLTELKKNATSPSPGLGCFWLYKIIGVTVH